MDPSVSVRSNSRGEISVSRQLHGQHMARPGWLLLAALGAIVLAFMVLSLAITATGTARFAVAMNYPAVVGYVVGGIFDFAKELLPVGLLVLLTRRAFILFAIIGCAWVGLVDLQRARDPCDGQHGHGCYRTQRSLEDGKPDQL